MSRLARTSGILVVAAIGFVASIRELVRVSSGPTPDFWM